MFNVDEIDGRSQFHQCFMRVFYCMQVFRTAFLYLQVSRKKLSGKALLYEKFVRKMMMMKLTKSNSNEKSISKKYLALE